MITPAKPRTLAVLPVLHEVIFTEYIHGAYAIIITAGAKKLRNTHNDNKPVTPASGITFQPDADGNVVLTGVTFMSGNDGSVVMQGAFFAKQADGSILIQGGI